MRNRPLVGLNVEVVIGLVAVLVVVVLAVTVFAVRRGGGDEMHSVQGYRQTLDTLREVGSRGGSSSVKVKGREQEAGASAGPGGAALVTESPDVAVDSGQGHDGDGSHGDGAGGFPVFGERVITADRQPAGDGALRSSQKESRQTRRAISAMNHRPRHVGASLLAGVVAAAAVAGLVYAVRAHKTPRGHHSSPPTTTVPPATTTTAPHHTPASHHPTTTTPATHKPSSTAYQPVTSSPNAATYAPPATSYNLTVNSSAGACWLQITEVATGATLYAQTLAQGQSQSTTLTGASTVVLGSPSSVTMTLDNEPVVLPLGFLTPFTVNLQPAPAGA